MTDLRYDSILEIARHYATELRPYFKAYDRGDKDAGYMLRDACNNLRNKVVEDITRSYAECTRREMRNRMNSLLAHGDALERAEDYGIHTFESVDVRECLSVIIRACSIIRDSISLSYCAESGVTTYA